MGPLVVELFDEGIEADLLLQDVGAGGAGGFLLQGQVHALMTAVLLRMPGFDPFDADAEAPPPHRKPGEMEEPVGGSELDAVVGADGARQTALPEKAFPPDDRVCLWLDWQTTSLQE